MKRRKIKVFYFILSVFLVFLSISCKDTKNNNFSFELPESIPKYENIKKVKKTVCFYKYEDVEYSFLFGHGQDENTKNNEGLFLLVSDEEEEEYLFITKRPISHKKLSNGIDIKQILFFYKDMLLECSVSIYSNERQILEDFLKNNICLEFKDSLRIRENRHSDNTVSYKIGFYMENGELGE